MSIARWFTACLILSWNVGPTAGWFRNPQIRHNFRNSDSGSKPVAFTRGAAGALHYVSMIPVAFGMSQGQALVPLYLRYRTTEWMDDAPAVYFDDNVTQHKPSWTYEYLIQDEANTSMADARFWAPDLFQLTMPLRNHWVMYYSLYNLKTSRTCIGRATINLTETDVLELPHYGPLSWRDDGKPIMCTYAREPLRIWNYTVQIRSLERNETLKIYREIANPAADGRDIVGENIRPLQREDVWQTQPRDLVVYPSELAVYHPSCVNLTTPGQEYDDSDRCLPRFGDAMEPSVFRGSGNQSLWMVYGSHKLTHSEVQRGLWLIQLDPTTGRPYNASTLPQHTAANFSARPQLLVGGRGNSSVSSGFIMSRRPPTSNMTYYYLIYTEASPGEEYRIPESLGASSLPNAHNNFTLSLRIVRATEPWGPYFDRDGNQLGSAHCCSLLMNSSLVHNIRTIARDHYFLNGDWREISFYRWRRAGYGRLWDQYGGIIRKSSIGFHPFCDASHPAIAEYIDKDGVTRHMATFTFRPCDALFADSFFASYEISWGPDANYTIGDPWPELSGAVWDPYEYVPPPPVIFPTVLVLSLILSCIFCTFGCGVTNFKWKKFKDAQMHPGMVMKIKHPWYSCVVDVPTIICNEVTFRWCGKIWCSTMSRTEALVSRYSDPIGEVKLAMDNYELEDGQRLLWLQKWKTLDKDDSNTMDFQEFIQLLDVSDSIWSRRIFEFYNLDFNGAIPLRDFVGVSFGQLVYDRTTAYQFAFRLISRRGNAFDLSIDVLDKIDLVDFIRARYPHHSEEECEALALAVFGYIDDDGSGGIAYQEFLAFSRTNFTFLLWGYTWQETLRAGIMGSKYWHKQTKSRQDIFVYDTRFFKKLDQKLARDQKMTKHSFKHDFPEVHRHRLELKNARAIAKKRKMMSREKDGKKGFSAIISAISRLLSNASGLNMRYAFYRWRDVAHVVNRAARTSTARSSASTSEPNSPQSPSSPNTMTKSFDKAHFALHAQILTDQRRVMPTSDELVEYFASDVIDKLHVPRHQLPNKHKALSNVPVAISIEPVLEFDV